jgi:hypothetical protein
MKDPFENIANALEITNNDVINKPVEKTAITNNSIYVGSTTDLQNLINKSRAQNKVIENDSV